MNLKPFKICLSYFYLFIPTDRKVWAFSGYNAVPGYPKKLTSFGLPRHVRKIDAALYDVQTRKSLFFVGSYYFRCVQSIY